MTPETITDAVYAGMRGNSVERDWLLSAIRAALRERDAEHEIALKKARADALNAAAELCDARAANMEDRPELEIAALQLRGAAEGVRAIRRT